jgi:uncharacterized protein DUF4304
MPSPKEMTRAAAQLSPHLRAAGFKRFGNDFNKQPEAGLIHVVGFQANKWGGSFTMNLGVYVREVDQLYDDWWGRSNKTGLPGEDGAVKEYACFLRARLGDIRHEGHDVWWQYADLVAAATDIAARVNHDALPAFADVSSRIGLIEWWRGRDRAPFRWRIEPRSPMGFALLMKQSGATHEAQTVVDSVATRTRGTPFRFRASVMAEDMGLEWKDESELEG